MSQYNYWSEGLHGVARSGNATSFPHGLGIASTWNTDLVQEMGDAISDEARGYSNEKGKGLSYWSPTINLARDPRWGRAEEGYGEDQFLTTAIAESYVNGMQGDDDTYLKTIATLKHFVANNSEYNRHTGSSDVDERDLREYYSYTFKNQPISGLIEDILEKDSKESYFIQICDFVSYFVHLYYKCCIKKNDLPNRVGKLIDKKFVGSVMATLKKSNKLNLKANKSNSYGLVIYPK